VVIDIKVSWIKSSSDKESFKIFKNIGLNVLELDNPEDVDIKIQELVQGKCRTIIVSSEVAGFSEDIVKAYAKSSDVNIIITPISKE